MRYAFLLVLFPLLFGCGAERRLAEQGADAVLWQNASAEAYWLYQQGYELAGSKLRSNLSELADEEQMVDPSDVDRSPCAVVVDVDETVLDNSPYQVNTIRWGRTFDPADWKAWTDQARARALPGALEFLQEVEGSGCEVFYITNRDTTEMASTLRNLDSLHFPFADEDHLLLMEGTSDKTARRARVAATHHVLLLVGDQLRDFDEAFKDRTYNHGKEVVDTMSDSLMHYFVLLSNPMYGTYRDAVQGRGGAAERLARMRDFFEHNGY